MNKKSLFGLFAMGTVLFAASCQEEDVVKQAQENSLATVSINVITPEMGVATRAMTFGNGKTAKTLHYAVYNVKDQGLTYLPDLTVDNHPIDISTTVDLQLVTGNNYKVIFWAGNDAAISTENEARLYTLNWDAKDENGDCNPTMTVDYDKALSNQESYDAFFNWMDINVDKSKTVSITLNRPFAQLNIGASDIAKAESAGYKLKQTQVKMTAYTTLEFWSRDVDRKSETSVVQDFKATDYPNYGKTKPATEEELAASDWEEYQVEGYEYMAMNYLLRPLDENRELEDVEFYFYAEDGEMKERKYASVPFRRNWRTNVYGQLITSDVDVNVTINPIFDGSYNIGVWDGHTLAKPYSFLNDNNTPDNDKDDFYEVHVYNGAELAYIADAINGGGQSNAANNGTRAADPDDNVDYYTATIVLKENIDLGGENWTPISGFEGTFDGKGYTVSNLKVSTEGRASAGLFGSSKGVIKNLTVKKADIQGHYKTGVIVGDGLCGKIENCHVKNATVLVTPYNYNDANNVGGIVGYLSAELTAYVKDCSVKNAEITAYRKVGGIVGAANGKAEVTGNTVENVTVVADFTMEYNEVKPADVGAIVGYAHANATVSNNTEGENVFAGNRIADGVYVVNGEYEIHTVAGLKWLAETVNNGVNNGGDNFSKKTVTLAKDIDLNAEEWTPIGNSTDAFQGTFDGKNHVVKNLVINAEGKSNIGLFGMTTNGEVKNLVVENAKVTGRLNVGVVAGTPYTSKYTNITVQGHVEVNGLSYVGGVGGKNAYANWTDVTVNVDETSYVKANSVENGTAYRTYVGGVCGFNGEGGHSFTNITSNINVSGSTQDVGGLFGIAHYGNKFVNCSSSGDVEIYAANKEAEAQEIGGIAGVWHNKDGYTVEFTNCSFTGTLKANNDYVINTQRFGNLVCAAYSTTGKGKLIIDGKEYQVAEFGVITDGTYHVENSNQLVDALENGYDVLMTTDLKIDPAGMSNAYGKTGINVKNGQTIDGGNNILDIKGAGGTWDSGINTTGGLIKNLTVTGSFRGIFINHNSTHSEKVVLENVIIDGTTYTISCDQGLDQGLEATNSTFKGWTSYAATLGNAKFTDCYFGSGNGYSYCRPYAPTEFVGCEFEAGFQVDPRAAVTFENCKLDGVALTAENLATLVISNISNATVK